MRAIISALAVAAILSGTAYAQERGAERVDTQQHAALDAQMTQATDIVAQINQAYGTHFVISDATPPTNADVSPVDVQPGSGGYPSQSQPSNPHTSWQFGPWLGRYQNGQ